jgi:4-diphosphocytidyl-2-C-methyl-D-erythritol kinase
VKNFKIKSYCKINLTLKVLKKLNDGYHNIMSLITFCDLHDVISISKISNSKDKISFSGRFKKGINTQSNTATKVLNLLKKNELIKNQAFKINIKKNITHGSGLGGGSSNAANLLNYFNLKMKLKLNKIKIKKLASQIGFDVPINLERRNTFLTGKKGKILRLNKKFKLNLLIVYPNLICSTRKVYKKNRKTSLSKPQSSFRIINNTKLINFLKNENNDLEKIVTKILSES